MSPPRRKSEPEARPGSRPDSQPESGPEAAEAVRTALTAEPGPVVLTGGQTGVDTLAARAGLAAGLGVHLVFPLGRRQEDGPVTADRLAELRGAVLHELAATEFARRTWACAGLADAVILIDPAGGDGCAETLRAASTLGRPLLDLTSFARESLPDAGGRSGSRAAVSAVVTRFLSENYPHVVLLAGCRASLLAATGRTSAAAGVVEAVMLSLADVTGGRPAWPPAGPATPPPAGPATPPPAGPPT